MSLLQVRQTKHNQKRILHDFIEGKGGDAEFFCCYQKSQLNIRERKVAFKKEIQRLKDNLNKLLASHTGQKVSKIEKDTERDNFMSADEACEYGLVDKVITSSISA